MNFIKSIFQPGNPGPLGGLRCESRRWGSEAHIAVTPDLRVRLWQVFLAGAENRPARPTPFPCQNGTFGNPKISAVVAPPAAPARSAVASGSEPVTRRRGSALR